MKAFLILPTLAAIAFCTDIADFFNTDGGTVKTTPVYNATLMIEGRGKVIYVDPVGRGNYKGLPKADLILITSDAPDHFDPDGIAKVSRKQTAIIAPAGPAPKLKQCTAMGNGETVGFGDVSVEAVPAYTKPELKGKSNGYVLTFPGLRVYISGDTGPIPELKAMKNVEVAFLGVGSPENMTLEEGVSAIHLFKPKTVYPYHFGKTTPEDLRKQLATPGSEIRVRHWD